MAYYLVERDFEPPTSLEYFTQHEPRLRFCLDSWRVSVLHTYVSADGRRVICIFEAPDLESVIAVQRTSGLPVTAIHPVTLHPAR